MHTLNPTPNGRYHHAAALSVAHDVCALLADVGQPHIAGSIRRNKPTVKDVEIVLQTDDPANARARLDNWIITGRARKSLYTDKNGNRSPRWGDKFRSITMYADEPATPDEPLQYNLKIEIYFANSDNFGYIYWLRTGPSDANQYAVTYLLDDLSARDGYIHHANRRIAVPDEQTMFALLKTRYVEPEHRSAQFYRHLRFYHPPQPRPPIVYLPDETPTQTTLF